MRAAASNTGCSLHSSPSTPLPACARLTGVQIAFALSFGLFNTLCFLCKRQVMKANDQRTVRVPSDDGKTSDTKSVRAYDLEAIDLMMVKGTMVSAAHPPPRRRCSSAQQCVHV